MKLRCVNAFGNFKPGEEIEVPDGAQFDTAYFEFAELKFVPELVKPSEFSELTKELEAEEGSE